MNGYVLTRARDTSHCLKSAEEGRDTGQGNSIRSRLFFFHFLPLSSFVPTFRSVLPRCVACRETREAACATGTSHRRKGTYLQKGGGGEGQGKLG